MSTFLTVSDSAYFRVPGIALSVHHNSDSRSEIDFIDDIREIYDCISDMSIIVK